MADEQPGPLDALATGALLAGRYRLRERVGRGGVADVFAAEDEVLRRPVAVKVFRSDAGTGEDPRRLQAEARTLAALRHPGLVMVLDAGAAPERAGELAAPYIVMELITGPTLSQRLTKGPLSALHTAVLGADLGTALAYVHAQGIVHRDVKPANVLFDTPTAAESPFAARLTEFGIARLVDSTRLTMHGMTVGTANYLSPEQARSSDVTAASDVYSLALVLIECLSGRLAYPGGGRSRAGPAASPAGHPDRAWTGLDRAVDHDDRRRPGRTPERRPGRGNTAPARPHTCRGDGDRASARTDGATRTCSRPAELDDAARTAPSAGGCR
ncbi:MAG: serine/threonine-protein kinase [Jatrophihabitantaceae bacterium]